MEALRRLACHVRKAPLSSDDPSAVYKGLNLHNLAVDLELGGIFDRRLLPVNSGVLEQRSNPSFREIKTGYEGGYLDVTSVADFKQALDTSLALAIGPSKKTIVTPLSCFQSVLEVLRRVQTESIERPWYVKAA
eukprot:Blabericola_migrator_1__2357@NODE_165_length_12243_cov_242_656784_g143_i0_p10_GENE_NODE_165_length_12243_cov_242_656784_g143_i0NODE_165_length_12243_cov_242_656784_g143_i0_p10_ORF_typecomplete_len134_score18_26_NODE_165_length_12243_cov_242_656784_g143_i058646265